MNNLSSESFYFGVVSIASWFTQAELDELTIVSSPERNKKLSGLHRQGCTLFVRLPGGVINKNKHNNHRISSDIVLPLP